MAKLTDAMMDDVQNLNGETYTGVRVRTIDVRDNEELSQRANYVVVIQHKDDSVTKGYVQYFNMNGCSAAGEIEVGGYKVEHKVEFSGVAANITLDIQR